jgi:hypothetical protein
MAGGLTIGPLKSSVRLIRLAEKLGFWRFDAQFQLFGNTV